MTAEVRRRQFYPKTDLAFDAAALPAIRARKEREALGLEGAVGVLCGEWVGEKVVQSRLLPGAGTFHAIYEIETQGGGAWIARVAMVPELGTAFHLAADSILFRQLAQVGVPTSSPVFADLTRARIPHDLQILPRARGVKVTTLENPETQAMEPELLHAVGATLARVHQVEGRGFGLVDWERHLRATELAGGHRDWAGYLLQNLAAHLAVCIGTGAVSEGEAGEITRRLEGMAPIWAASPCRLLHGDPGHHNFYAANREVTALLDWEDALCGDPVFDLAHWGTFTREGMLAEMLGGYFGVRRREGAKEEEMGGGSFWGRYWGYYLRIAVSKTAHRHWFGVPERAGRPLASRRIQLALERLRALD